MHAIYLSPAADPHLKSSTPFITQAIQTQLACQTGKPGKPVIDIRYKCSGFLYGQSIADQFIRAGTYCTILVVGSEVHSTDLDFSPEASGVCIIFGDGAGAAILGPAKDSAGSIACRLHADGRFAHELMVQASGTRLGVQIDHKMIYKKMHDPKMIGRAVFRSAVINMTAVVEDILKSEGLALEDIVLQTQRRQLSRLRLAKRWKKIGFAMAIWKCLSSLDRVISGQVLSSAGWIPPPAIRDASPRLKMKILFSTILIRF